MSLNFIDLVSLTYDSALGEADWNDALSAISTFVDSSALLLVSGNPKDGTAIESNSVHLNGSASWSDATHADIFSVERNPALSSVLRMPLLRTIDRRTVLSDSELRNSSLTKQTVGRAGITQFQMFVTERSSDFLAAGLFGKPGKDELDTDHVKKFALLLPHIARAQRMRHEIGRHRAEAEGLQSLFQGLSVAAIIVNQDLGVLAINENAERIVSENDGISMHSKHLRLANNDQLSRLKLEVRKIKNLKDVTNSSPISVLRPSGLLPYSVRVYSAVGICNLPGAQSAAACLIVSNPTTKQILVDVSYLNSALGLTPTEAVVAQLIPLAMSKLDTAKRLGVSLNTVKYHHANIRQKLNARNMTEVAQIILRLVN